MRDYSNNKNRKPIRLKDYDFSQANAYFITIKCHKGRFLLSDKMTKEIVVAIWESLPSRFDNIDIDEFIVMPNHVHGIITIKDIENGRRGGACPSRGAASSAPTDYIENKKSELNPPPIDKLNKKSRLSDIVRVFKSLTAIQVNKHLGRTGQPFWQRSFYDHVVRNENDLFKCRNYIRYNRLRHNS